MDATLEFELTLTELDVPGPVRQDAVGLLRCALNALEGAEARVTARHRREARAVIEAEDARVSVIVERGSDRPRLSATVDDPSLPEEVLACAAETGVRSFSFDLQGEGLRVQGRFDVGYVQVEVVGGERGRELLDRLRERGLRVVEV